MWSFGHHVREIERSHDRVVIEETATTGGVWLFSAFSALTLALILTEPKSWWAKRDAMWVGIGAVLFFAAFAGWASVRSTFTADRRTGRLVIERKVFFWTVRNAYDSHAIDHVYVRDTPKGSGLYLRLKSGEMKRLSMTLEFISLSEAAVTLNDALFLGRRR